MKFLHLVRFSLIAACLGLYESALAALTEEVPSAAPHALASWKQVLQRWEDSLSSGPISLPVAISCIEELTPALLAYQDACNTENPYSLYVASEEIECWINFLLEDPGFESQTQLLKDIREVFEGPVSESFKSLPSSAQSSPTEKYGSPKDAHADERSFFLPPFSPPHLRFPHTYSSIQNVGLNSTNSSPFGSPIRSAGSPIDLSFSRNELSNPQEEL